MTIANATRGGDAEELREHLAAIAASSEDAILDVTPDGVITSWNPGAAHMYGYTADEMAGHTMARLSPPERADELAPVFSLLWRGERIDHCQAKCQLPLTVVLRLRKWPLSTWVALASKSVSENGFSTRATPGSSLPWEARTGRA